MMDRSRTFHATLSETELQNLTSTRAILDAAVERIVMQIVSELLPVMRLHIISNMSVIEQDIEKRVAGLLTDALARAYVADAPASEASGRHSRL